MLLWAFRCAFSPSPSLSGYGTLASEGSFFFRFLRWIFFFFHPSFCGVLFLPTPVLSSPKGRRDFIFSVTRVYVRCFCCLRGCFSVHICIWESNESAFCTTCHVAVCLSSPHPKMKHVPPHAHAHIQGPGSMVPHFHSSLLKRSKKKAQERKHCQHLLNMYQIQMPSGTPNKKNLAQQKSHSKCFNKL